LRLLLYERAWRRSLTGYRKKKPSSHHLERCVSNREPLACLAADQKLGPRQPWRQESILGSVFEGTYGLTETGIIPTITGQAFITAESTLILDPADPFQMGIS
jgi:proline racemase